MPDAGNQRRWGIVDAGVCCLLCLLFFNLYAPGVPNPGDLVLALPIAQELADPGLYAPEDLVIDSGKRLPFHVYRLTVALYRAGIDVALPWYALYQVFLFATFAGQYALGFATWRRPDAAAGREQAERHAARRLAQRVLGVVARSRVGGNGADVRPMDRVVLEERDHRI